MHTTETVPHFLGRRSHGGAVGDVGDNGHHSFSLRRDIRRNLHLTVYKGNAVAARQESTGKLRSDAARRTGQYNDLRHPIFRRSI